jgi:hypothetical protein
MHSSQSVELTSVNARSDEGSKDQKAGKARPKPPQKKPTVKANNSKQSEVHVRGCDGVFESTLAAVCGPAGRPHC